MLLLVLFALMTVMYVIWLRRTLAERSKRLDIMRYYSSLVENMPIMYARERLVDDAAGLSISSMRRSIPLSRGIFCPGTKYWVRNTAN